MENQEIKEKQIRQRCPKFTEQEDIVIKLAIKNTEGHMHDRCEVTAKLLASTFKH